MSKCSRNVATTMVMQTSYNYEYLTQLNEADYHFSILLQAGRPFSALPVKLLCDASLGFYTFSERKIKLTFSIINIYSYFMIWRVEFQRQSGYSA